MKRILILLLLATLAACANKPMLVAPPVMAKPEVISSDSTPMVAQGQKTHAH